MDFSEYFANYFMRLTVSIKVADRKTFGYFEKTDSIKQYYWVP